MVRAWFGGPVPPDPEAVMKAEAADDAPECLYSVKDGEETGEWAPLVQSLRRRMEAARASSAGLSSCTPERARAAFATVLFDLAGSPADRARLLQKVGALKLDPQDPQSKARAVRALADTGKGRSPEGWAALGAELDQLWKPRGLLKSVLEEPGAAAAAIAARLDPGHEPPLVIWGHGFGAVARHLLEPLAQAQVVAYERDQEIHVVTAVRQALDAWDGDAHLQLSPDDVPLIEVLLLHEVLEALLHETTQLPALAAHLVAATLGRCLRDTMLNIAVEAFCLDWLGRVPAAGGADGGRAVGAGSDPDLSAEEAAEAERRAAGRTADEQEGLLEEMFADEAPEAPPERSSGKPRGRQVSPPEPVIRSAAGGESEDLAGMFDADEEPAPAASTGAARQEEDGDGRRKRTYHFAPAEGEGPRVLVVDDSSMTRHLVCEVVRKLGCQVIEAVDGVQAVAMGRFHKPGLIVLDIAMPGGNGLDALRQLRASPECAATPIIMLTVESSRESIREAIRQGATDYLIKPVNVDELSKRVAQHLGLEG